MVADETVRLPTIRELLWLIQEDRIGIRELGKQAICTGAAHNDAGLAVTREHHAHAAGFKMERGRVASASKGMPHKNDCILSALNLVCG